MKKSILAVAAIAASCASAGIYTHTTYTGSDMNLKTLAVVTDGKFVLGTGDYSDSEWAWTKERVYDGVTELQNGESVDYRWFEPGSVHGDSECNWAGYQTTEPVVVTHVSFITRHDDYASRARGCRFEGANKADFSDAVALYAVPADAEIETLKADGGDWTVVAQGLTEQQYVDRPERPTRVGYIYRVASVDVNGGLAYTISITPTGTPAAPGLAITIR